MPRTPRTTSTSRRPSRRSARAGAGTGLIVGQISQIVQANATLTQENQVLAAENERLRRELTEIGSVLDRLTGGTRRGGGRRLAEPEPAPRRTRKPITDPAVLERRRQALARARQARSEKLAAARAAAASDGQSG